MAATPSETIVLVHGLWMTPRSWEHWVTHYESQGHTVLTPGYPGFEVEVEALRENPQVIADLTVPETLDHLAAVVEGAGPRRSSSATPSAGRSPSCSSPAGSARRGWSSTPPPPRACGSARSRRPGRSSRR